MTAPAAPAVAEPLTTEGRMHLLLDLHHGVHAGSVSFTEWEHLLRQYAHPLLPWPQAAGYWQAHEQAVARVNALRSGEAHWSEFYEEDDLCGWPGDLQDGAVEQAQDEARDLLWRLANGG